MAQYIHIKKADISAQLKYISWTQSQTGLFYNVSVLPYRGKKYNPDLYITIKIG